MRTPGSLDEFEHMLNAAGWQLHGIRKQGTRMRQTDEAEFIMRYRNVLNKRVLYLKERVDVLARQEMSGASPLRLQKEIIEKELTQRFGQLMETAGT